MRVECSRLCKQVMHSQLAYGKNLPEGSIKLQKRWQTYFKLFLTDHKKLDSKPSYQQVWRAKLTHSWLHLYRLTTDGWKSVARNCTGLHGPLVSVDRSVDRVHCTSFTWRHTRHQRGVELKNPSMLYPRYHSKWFYKMSTSQHCFVLLNSLFLKFY